VSEPLPLGKLPPALLANLISSIPTADPQLRLGPGIGLDCAILEVGDRLLALKSEPITFATAEIGWYGVQIAANDIATTGGVPRWMLATLLLPEGKTSPELVQQIAEQIATACREMGIVVIGGHTEITYGLDRPILNTTLIGEIEPGRLVTPKGARPGDAVLLTKGVPIEATAILARERAEELRDVLTEAELREAQDFLYRPGISVVPAARLAAATGAVTAMHDPTEGGLANALWELAEAANVSIAIEPAQIPIYPLARTLCNHFGIDPLGAIASGALLLTTHPGESERVCAELISAGIPCAVIGRVESGSPAVWQPAQNGRVLLPQPRRDEIARLFERSSPA
jgi:hydrogenase maturation factor